MNSSFMDKKFWWEVKPHAAVNGSCRVGHLSQPPSQLFTLLRKIGGLYSEQPSLMQLILGRSLMNVIGVS